MNRHWDYRPRMRHGRPAAFLGVCVLLATAAAPAAPTDAEKALKAIDVRRGICVIAGDGAAALAADLARLSGLTVYVQTPNGAEVAEARLALDEAGLLNSRVYVESGPLARLHLADNLADALIAVGQADRQPGGIPQAEVLRVLRPQGRAILGERVIVKPFPEGVDEWTHPYHGPDNNPRSSDRLARWPFATQFFAAPHFGPAPAVTLLARGRLFTFYGHIAWHQREEALRNTLVATNAYNGTVLWRRKLAEGYMVHRNVMAAADDALYHSEGPVCHVLDAATGKLLGDLAAPPEAAEQNDTHWKWLALDGGVLYAVFGPPERPDTARLWRRSSGGWPWTAMSEGFNDPKRVWGDGHTVAALDPRTGKTLWTCRLEEPVDTRAVCMKGGRMFLFSFGAALTALEARTGKQLWRRTAKDEPKFFETLGPYDPRQGAATNWKTTAYLRCTDKALYFAGPQMKKLVAVSVEDGRVIWEDPYDNYELVLFDDFLLGVSGAGKKMTRRLDLLSGKVLSESEIARRSCTRPTASIDSVFFRAAEGTIRHDLAGGTYTLLSPMRPSCLDGVVVGGGLTFWMPWVCDCNLTMFGMAALAPAGERPADAAPGSPEISERTSAAAGDLKVSQLDWPTYRADNARTAVTSAPIAEQGRVLWQYEPKAPCRPTAPVAAGGLVFLAGEDGVVRALDAATGREAWKACTGGEIRYPPAIRDGRALVGSGDGWVYCLDAATGTPLWRFRAAPAERNIPVFGKLLSTWPAAGGVLVEGDTAYVAAGIVNYDGTHVCALDAATGKVKWRNGSSGHVEGLGPCGVSVQGHLLLHGGRLYLAGGNVISPAAYNIADGKYVGPKPSILATPGPRGRELLLGPDGVVRVTGQPLYNVPDQPTLVRGNPLQTFHARTGRFDLAWINERELLCFDKHDLFDGKAFAAWWQQGPKPAKRPAAKPMWGYQCEGSAALAAGANAVAVATGLPLAVNEKGTAETPRKLVVLSLADGKPMWSHDLPGTPLRWGLAVDRDGRVIAAMEDGRVLCFGK